MKKYLNHLTLVFIPFLLCTYSLIAQHKNLFVFANVNVIPMNKNELLQNYHVVIQNGKISKLGPASTMKLPKNATIINAKGKFMIPTLSDMHVHLEGEAWNIMYPPEKKFTKEEIDYNDILFLYLANGVTTLNVMSAFPEHVELRNKINKNEMLGPRLILSRMVDGHGKAWPPPISTWVNNPNEAKKAVIEMKKKGYDRVKVYSFLDKASYDTIVATAKSINMPFDGHIPLSTSVEHVIASGQSMIAHSEEIMKFAKDHSPEQISYFAKLIAESDTWLTATLTTSHNLIALLENDKKEFSKSETKYLHPLGLGIWTYINENLYKPIPEQHRKGIRDGYKSFQIPFTYEFYKRGGKLLTGTDALIPPNVGGFSIHQELEELVSAGLSSFEALKVSTTNAYEFLGELDKAGTIEVGKNANLLLLDENPLKGISNTRKIFGVMMQNRWISKDDIDKRLKEISESYTKLRSGKFQ